VQRTLFFNQVFLFLPVVFLMPVNSGMLIRDPGKVWYTRQEKDPGIGLRTRNKDPKERIQDN